MNKKTDFSFHKFVEILDCLLDKGYSFQGFEDFLNNPAEKVVILRHDVDKFPLHSLQTAKLENSRGIRGTYYFRIVRQSYKPEIIRAIAALGHEIGYHYEDLSIAWAKLRAQGAGQRAQGEELERQIVELGIESFKKNLEDFRKIAPVITICMHGSPMSRWDSRILWKYYDYHDFGIIGEPYFDIDFEKVLYLTDTGRKWNGDKSSVRDKVLQDNFRVLKRKLKSSGNIIESALSNELPQQLMITFHPQRWTDNPLSWLGEYASQVLKNRIKQLIFVR